MVLGHLRQRYGGSVASPHDVAGGRCEGSGASRCFGQFALDKLDQRVEVAHGVAHESVELRLLGRVLFELLEAFCELHEHWVGRKLSKLASHGDESARHGYAHLGSTLAPEHCGNCESPLLSEDERQMAAPTVP